MIEKRPAELQEFQETEYPEVDTASGKLAVLERLGFSPIGCFVLPQHCWLDNCYRPLEQHFSVFPGRHGISETARATVKAHDSEISLYEGHKAFFGYGYFVARKSVD